MTPENAKARAWLASEFRRIGVEPVDGRYLHPWVRARRAGADSVRGANVLGLIRGRTNATRVIVVSAHYDHVGTRNGQIYNGADDNASGTAAVLAMAAHFKTHPPAHTILFALWDAEEMGLLGARAFVDAPAVPLATIAANVNLDMVSRNDKGELYAAGATPWPAMRPVLESLVSAASVKLMLGHDSGGGSNDWTDQSDQGAFNAAKIPFVYFGVEDHPDYHKPTDDSDRIQPGFFYRAARTIAGFVERLDAAVAGWPAREGARSGSEGWLERSAALGRELGEQGRDFAFRERGARETLAAHADDSRFDRRERPRELGEQLLALQRPVAHAVRRPREVGSAEQVEVGATCARLALDPRRTCTVVVSGVDHGAHKIGIAKEQRRRRAQGVVLELHGELRDRSDRRLRERTRNGLREPPCRFGYPRRVEARGERSGERRLAAALGTGQDDARAAHERRHWKKPCVASRRKIA